VEVGVFLKVRREQVVSCDDLVEARSENKVLVRTTARMNELPGIRVLVPPVAVDVGLCAPPPPVCIVVEVVVDAGGGVFATP